MHLQRKHKKWQSRHHKLPQPPPSDEQETQQFHHVPDENIEPALLPELSQNQDSSSHEVRSNSVPIVGESFAFNI